MRRAVDLVHLVPRRTVAGPDKPSIHVSPGAAALFKHAMLEKDPHAQNTATPNRRPSRSTIRSIIARPTWSRPSPFRRYGASHTIEVPLRHHALQTSSSRHQGLISASPWSGQRADHLRGASSTPPTSPARTSSPRPAAPRSSCESTGTSSAQTPQATQSRRRWCRTS